MILELSSAICGNSAHGRHIRRFVPIVHWSHLGIVIRIPRKVAADVVAGQFQGDHGTWADVAVPSAAKAQLKQSFQLKAATVSFSKLVACALRLVTD